MFLFYFIHNSCSELGAKPTSMVHVDKQLHQWPQFIYSELLQCVSVFFISSYLWLFHLSMFVFQSLVTRLKENLEKMTEERDQRIGNENREKDQNKRMQRQIRDIKEEITELSKKEAEASRKKHELVSSRAPPARWRFSCITLATIMRGNCHNGSFTKSDIVLA